MSRRQMTLVASTREEAVEMEKWMDFIENMALNMFQQGCLETAKGSHQGGS